MITPMSSTNSLPPASLPVEERAGYCLDPRGRVHIGRRRGQPRSGGEARRNGRILWALSRPLFVLGCLVVFVFPAFCQYGTSQGGVPQGGLPKPLLAVGIDQHLNEMLPLDLTFKDESGKEVRLGDYF